MNEMSVYSGGADWSRNREDLKKKCVGRVS